MFRGKKFLYKTPTTLFCYQQSTTQKLSKATNEKLFKTVKPLQVR
jgi:hypothetical protein